MEKQEQNVLSDEVLSEVVGGTVGPNGISDEKTKYKIGQSIWCGCMPRICYTIKSIVSIDEKNPGNTVYHCGQVTDGGNVLSDYDTTQTHFDAWINNRMNKQ